MTLDEMEHLIESACFASDLFGHSDWQGAFKKLRLALHPDKFADLAEKERAERLFRRLGTWKTLAETPERLEGGETSYFLGRELGKGDLSTVRMASDGAGNHYVAKTALFKAVSKLLLREREVTDLLQYKAGADLIAQYLPNPVESFLLSDQRRVTIFSYTPGMVSAEAVRKAFPDGVGGRHLVWMFKRCLTAIAFAHQNGWVHGAVLPPHLMFRLENHGLKLVDWTLAVSIGKPIIAAPQLFKEWYPPECAAKKPANPSLDVYLAAKSMIYLAGGDPVAETFPDSIPKPLKVYFKGCLLKSPSMRPQNAWRCVEDITDLAQRLYGAPKFHELKI